MGVEKVLRKFRKNVIIMSKIIITLGVTFLFISYKEREPSVSQYIAVAQEHLISVEYTAFSRGYFMAISIDENFIKKYKDPTHKEFDSKKCTEKDWNSVLLNLDAIAVDKIDQLIPPDNKSFSDRSAQAQLKIISGKEIYTSVNFDHGNPPEKLKPLVDIIISLTKNMK